MEINAIYQLSEKPTIYFSKGIKHWEEIPAQKNRAYLITHPMWFFNWKSVFIYWKYKLILKKKNINLIILNNSSKEHKIAKYTGLKSFKINQNLHTNEHIFKVLDNVPKRYDAVYTAAAKKYKRLHLASKIKDLFVVTYFWPDVRNEKGEWDLHAFEPRIKNADFNRYRLSSQEVNEYLNKSACGLALSRKEGAMWASMEYLLAGLPIVSTESIGGRDLYFDERFVEIVEDNPNAVLQGVNKMVEKDIDPHFIRSETLKKVKKNRRKFYKLIQDITKSQGGELEPYEIFHNKLWSEKGFKEELKII